VPDGAVRFGQIAVVAVAQSKGVQEVASASVHDSIARTSLAHAARDECAPVARAVVVGVQASVVQAEMHIRQVRETVVAMVVVAAVVDGVGVAGAG